MPEIVKDATNQIMEYARSGKEDFSNEKIINLALYLAGVYIFLSFMKGVFLFFTRQTIIVMSRLIEYDLKNEIYNKYQKQHLEKTAILYRCIMHHLEVYLI